MVLTLLVLLAGLSLASGALRHGRPLPSPLVGFLLIVGTAAACALVGILVADSLRPPLRFQEALARLSGELLVGDAPLEIAHALERAVQLGLGCDGASVELARRSGRHPDDHAAPDIALTVPIVFRGEVLATVHLGRTIAASGLSAEDRDFVAAVANLGALALAHVISSEELGARCRQQAAAFRDERAALVETLSAEIAHEVRYPINFFRSVFERAGVGSTLEQEDVDIGREEVERLERLVSGLRRISAQHLEPRRVEMSELCARTEVLLRDRLGARRLVFDSPELSIRCDPDKVIQILVNLLANALDAAGEDGEVGLCWAVEPSAAARVEVWDTGPGFEGESSRLFNAWYTTKPRGTGLGLAIVSRLVSAHGWTIEALRRAQRTVFIVNIPERDVVATVPTGDSGVRQVHPADAMGGGETERGAA